MTHDAYLGGPADAGSEAQLAQQAQEVARELSDGGKNMLLHIARICPLPKPFPPPALGQFHLLELRETNLIAKISATAFCPTALGAEVAKLIQKPAQQGGTDV